MSQTCLEATYSDSLAAECSTSRSVGGIGLSTPRALGLVAVTAAIETASISNATLYAIRKVMMSCVYSADAAVPWVGGGEEGKEGRVERRGGGVHRRERKGGGATSRRQLGPP